MAEAKTQKTAASVEEFLATVEGAERRADAHAVCALMREVTGVEPAMWGPSIVGFGQYSYIYKSGRTGDWPAAAFSPRKGALTVYLAEGFDDDPSLMAKLGPHTTSKVCLYIKRMSDVDTKVLGKLVKESYKLVNGKTIAS